MLKDTDHCPHLAIGPIVWEISDGSDTRHWYFMVGSADRDGQFRFDCLKTGTVRPLAEWARKALMLEFIQRRVVVIHDFDGELSMLQFCAEVFPGEKTRALLAALVAEQR